MASSLAHATADGHAAPLAEAFLNDDQEPESDARETREVSIDVTSHGLRLDRALSQHMPEFSRSFLQQLLQGGAVQLTTPTPSPSLKPSAKVRLGQVYRIEIRPTLQSQAFIPEPMPLQIVYEDEHLRIIDKPAGLVVHPAPGNWRGTLLNGLLALDPAAALLPRAGIVHRLDKDTSGLMLVARTRACMDRLVAQIAAREVHREYLAIVQGPWTGPPVLEIEAAIGRDPRNRLRMAVVDLAHQSGKQAHTTVRCLQSNEVASWVHCQLHTGRTHQIRVHLAHVGHRLVGDALYGGAALAGLQRQALHAFRLSLQHPVTGTWLSCRSPWPQVLDEALSGVGLRYNESHLPALA